MEKIKEFVKAFVKKNGRQRWGLTVSSLGKRGPLGNT
jgi:hypothetical protein